MSIPLMDWTTARNSTGRRSIVLAMHPMDGGRELSAVPSSFLRSHGSAAATVESSRLLRPGLSPPSRPRMPVGTSVGAGMCFSTSAVAPLNSLVTMGVERRMFFSIRRADVESKRRSPIFWQNPSTSVRGNTALLILRPTFSHFSERRS